MELDKIKENVQRMYSTGAPEEDIDAYVRSVGATPKDLGGKPAPRYEHELTRLTGGMITRPTAASVGATLGMVGGMPAGPMGIAGGGVLGAGGGSLTFDLAEALARRATGRKPVQQGPFEPTKQAIQEMGMESVLGAAGPMVGPLAKRAMGGLLKVATPAARQLTQAGERMGIGLGTAHVSPRKVPRGYAKVIGAFPIAGTPFRSEQERLVKQIGAQSADLLDTLAPISKLGDLGTRLTQAAKRRYAAFNRVAAGLYKRFYDLADDLPEKEIVDTQPVKDWLQGLTEREARERIVTEGGGILRPPGTDALGEYISKLGSLPGKITVEQARGLERTLNGILRGSKEAFDVSRLSGLKEALQASKGSLDLSRVSPDQAAQVMDAWEKANAFFRTQRQVFETPVAKKFGKVQKNIFDRAIFKSGTITHDDVFKNVFDGGSIEAQRGLRDLVGPVRFKEASRRYLDDALQNSILPAKEGGGLPDLFSSTKFRNRLKLDTPEGMDAFKEMIKGAGSTADDWMDFLKVVDSGANITIRDPSQFVARRAILSGGLAGITGALAIGASKVSLPVAILVTQAARKGAKVLMNPRTLKDMQTLALPSATNQMKKAAFLRMLRVLATPTPREEPKRSRPRTGASGRSLPGPTMLGLAPSGA